MTGKIQYDFVGKVWKYEGPAGWYFVSLPTDMAKEIRSLLKMHEEGWGRLKTTAKMGNSEWRTAIWFDTKSSTYLLPIKADIRTKEKIGINKEINVSIWL